MGWQARRCTQQTTHAGQQQQQQQAGLVRQLPSRSLQDKTRTGVAVGVEQADVQDADALHIAHAASREGGAGQGRPGQRSSPPVQQQHASDRRCSLLSSANTAMMRART